MSNPPQDGPPPLVDQVEMPYGIWRANQYFPDFGEMTWEPNPNAPHPEMRQLRDQQHESGSWWSGSAESMTWMANRPAPNPMPEQNEENRLFRI